MRLMVKLITSILSSGPCREKGMLLRYTKKYVGEVGTQVNQLKDIRDKLSRHCTLRMSVHP